MSNDIGFEGVFYLFAVFALWCICGAVEDCATSIGDAWKYASDAPVRDTQLQYDLMREMQEDSLQRLLRDPSSEQPR